MDGFQEISAATVYEAMGKKGAMDHAIKPVYPGAKVCGTAVTVLCYPADNLMLHKAITIAEPGDVLVANVGGYLEAGGWGEIASVAAIERGIMGLITDGAVRDVSALKRLGFPVFAKGVSIKGTTKEQLGLINHPIECGGVWVRPGDIVLGDEDGVVVIPQEKASWVLEKSKEREANEARIMAKLREGKLTLDLLGLRETLERKGLMEE